MQTMYGYMDWATCQREANPVFKSLNLPGLQVPGVKTCSTLKATVVGVVGSWGVEGNSGKLLRPSMTLSPAEGLESSYTGLLKLKAAGVDLVAIGAVGLLGSRVNTPYLAVGVVPSISF